LADAGLDALLELMEEERLVEHRQQALGEHAAERAQPGGAAAGKDDGLGVGSQRGALSGPAQEPSQPTPSRNRRPGGGTALWNRTHQRLVPKTSICPVS